MCKQKRITKTCEYAINNRLSPRRNLLYTLPTRYSIVPQGSARPFDLNLGGSFPFIVSVVEVDNRVIAISCEAAGFAGTKKRACQHHSKAPASQKLAYFSRLAFSSCS